VILVDANLLLYAKITDYAQHEAARTWLDAQLGGTTRVGLPWPSLLAFLRIGTNSRLFPHPMGGKAAWDQVAQWLDAPAAWVPTPTDRHAAILGDLIERTGAAANLIPDAHLATLAVEYGLTLCSTDGDFARFPQLRWMNPL
jgi:hypothetical protein